MGPPRQRTGEGWAGGSRDSSPLSPGRPAMRPATRPATAPATASQAVRSAPQKVILQASDVPADYLLETDDAMSPQQLADGLSTSTKMLEQRGASGYVRAFKQPDQQFRCCLIDS